MVEMAFILPLLVFMLFGVMEFGRVFVEWQIVQSSALSGARSASLYRADCIQATVESEVSATVDAIISANPITRNKPREVVVTNPCSTTAENLCCVTVRLRTDLGVLARFAEIFSGSNELVLASTAAMRPEAALGSPTGAASCGLGI